MSNRNQGRPSVTVETMSEPYISTTHMDNQKKKKRRGNWRLDILSTPRVRNAKYEKPIDQIETGVRPEALKAEPRERDDQMSIPPLRLLYVNKRTYAGMPTTSKRYGEILDKHIDKAWNSIYNEYKKARRDKRLRQLERQARKAQKAKKGRKGKSGGKSGKTKHGSERKLGKKGKDDDAASTKSEDNEKRIQEWINRSSKPKQVPNPEPINRGPRADLEAMKERIDIIATPTNPREKYKPEPPPKHIVNEAALSYEATERILEISKPTAHRLLKDDDIVLGAVKPGALLYKTTERDERLATPRTRATANDADLKEDPFSISKNALKYKASPRIIELAKPRERK